MFFCVLIIGLNGTDWSILRVFDLNRGSDIIETVKLFKKHFTCEVVEVWLFRNGSIMEQI